jgi:hypothetical protein
MCMDKETTLKLLVIFLPLLLFLGFWTLVGIAVVKFIFS